MKPQKCKEYRFKYGADPEILIYVGHNWSGNGYWHQFELAKKRGKVWCEITDSELDLIEEVKNV